MTCQLCGKKTPFYMWGLCPSCIIAQGKFITGPVVTQELSAVDKALLGQVKMPKDFKIGDQFRGSDSFRI